MSGSSRRAVTTALGLAVLFMVSMLGGVAEAAVGDLVPGTPVAVAPSTNCDFEGSNFGTAVAIIPGGKLGFPSIPTLVVTSCLSGSTSTLFFLDPSTNPATLRASVVSATASEWQALALRADTADMLACNSGDGVAMYVIHVSPFDPAATVGTTNFIGYAPYGATCEGIAWDAADKTVYQTSFTNTNPTGSVDILHYVPVIEGDVSVTVIPSGCPGSVGGIGIAGASLFVACDAVIPDGPGDVIPASIRQLDKTNGNLVRPPLTNAQLPNFAAGLPDDPGSFAGKEVLWAKAASFTGGQLFAFEIAAGTLGQVQGPPMLFPAACDQITGSAPDTDGDGLLDCWEDGVYWSDNRPGISTDGVYTAGRSPAFRAVTLCVDMNANNTFDAGECASPTHKDIFVEIDYMQGHRPDAVAMNNVVNAFANAPVSNPDNTTGIRLHLLIDDQVPHADRTQLVPCTPVAGAGDADFDALKKTWFGTNAERTDPLAGVRLNAKRNAYHYAAIVHNMSGAGNTSSGCGEILGNDFMVSLGSFAVVNGHNVGNTDQQAGTFMHELGHNLALRHGGAENLNCKPNYTSVMNYSYQFSSPVNPRPLDYSRQALATLLESSLNEATGVGGFAGSVVWGPPSGIPPKPSIGLATGAINWNKAGTSTDSGVSRDLNWTNSASCPGSPGETLVGFNDWANIKLNFRTSIDFADGAHATIDGTVPELNLADSAEMSLDTDGDGVADIAVDTNGNYAGDNCPLTQNADQTDTDHDGIGDACSLAVKILRPSIPSTSQGVVQIAIFGSATRDVTKIDPASIAIHGAATQGVGIWSVRARDGGIKCTVKDTNGDGKADLVCQFKIDARQLPVGTSIVTLEAATFVSNGISEALRGTDTLDVRDVGTGQ